MIDLFAERFSGVIPTNENENELVRCEECSQYKTGACFGKGLTGKNVVIKCLAPFLGLRATVKETCRKGRYKNCA